MDEETGVTSGDVIAVLRAPELSSAAAEAHVRIAQLQTQLDRGVADAEDLSARAVIERQLAAERDALAGIMRRQRRLVLRTPIAGVVVDLGAQIHAGRWLGGSDLVARVVSAGEYDVQAYVAEADVARIHGAVVARFVPDDALMPSRPAKLVERSASAVQRMDQPILASTNGGPIAVDQDASQALRPREALYRMRFVATRGAGMLQPVAGRMHIPAEAGSMVQRIYVALLRILREEASLSSG